MKKLFSYLAIAVVIANCSPEQPHVDINQPIINNAVAIVQSINGSEVSGSVNFENTENGVQVTATLSGLTGTMHGFHIHQYGDCSADDGTSAGGHFNPRGNEHAGPDAMNRHMGDMGNINADENGNATLDYVDGTINMNQIIGRGIIVHGGVDDLESQPSGAAGPRIGCGVIGIQK